MKIGMISGYHSGGFDFARDSKMEFIEICNNFDSDTENFMKSAESIKANIERTGVLVGSVGRWNHSLNEGGKINREKLKKYIWEMETAAYLGSPVYVCGINRDPSVSMYKNYTAAIEMFGAIIEAAKDKNIKIAVQNCDWNNFIVNPADWDIVLGELDELTIKYDCSHSYNRGNNYLSELSDWCERVSHIHIKGTTHAGGKRWVDDPPAGMDDIKWPSVFSVLYARGYDGGLSIEPHSKTWHGELGAKGINFTYNYISKFLL